MNASGTAPLIPCAFPCRTMHGLFAEHWQTNILSSGMARELPSVRKTVLPLRSAVLGSAAGLMQAPGHFGLPTDLKRLWLQCRYTGTPAYRQSPHTTANMVAALTAQPAGEAHCGLVCIPASWVWDRNAPKNSTLPSPARANFLQWLPPAPPSSVARRCAPRLKQPAVLTVAARYADSPRSVDRPVYPCASPTAETGAVSGAAVSSPPDACCLRSIERASSAPAAARVHLQLAPPPPPSFCAAAGAAHPGSGSGGPGAEDHCVDQWRAGVRCH